MEDMTKETVIPQEQEALAGVMGEGVQEPSQELSDSERKKGMTKVGLRYAAFAVIVILIQIVSAIVLQVAAPQYLEDHQVFLSLLLTLITMDAIGFPLVWVLNRKLPALKPQEEKLGVGKFILGIFFCAGICGAGILIGTILHLGVSMLLGQDGNANNTIATLMLNSDPFMRILTVGICAPIFEELIFRKVLVDHMMKYGKCVAVAASGIMFGLFHGNFSQCFFAAGLGFFFAYIYLKTGKLRYTIAYHMIINLTTSVISMAVIGYYYGMIDKVGGLEVVTSGSPEIAMQMLPATLIMLGWLGFLGIVALVGFILLCVNLGKLKLKLENGEPKFGKALKMVFTTPGIWAFFAVCLFLFAKNYLL